MADETTDVQAVVPRWEWRIWREDLGEAGARFAELTPERVQESDETYLVSVNSEASVKVRDGVMDVKELVTVDGDGLEQWRPVMKAALPLPAADARKVMGILGVDSPSPARDAYTLDELVDELVRPSAEVLAIEVHKRRAHYTVGGCMAERSELSTKYGARQTIAIESEDPARVVATVHELGLDLVPNVSLERELKTLAGFGAHRFAVMDVGSNSVKFLIAERSADGWWRRIVDRAEVTQLGEGLADAGRLGDEPIERTVGAIAAMADEARSKGVEQIAAVGTAALRIAPNSAKLVDAARERAGVEVKVLDGEEEARLAYLAATSGLGVGSGSRVVFDTGGASTQFTFGSGESVEERFSLNIGAVRITEQWNLDGVLEEGALHSALDAIAEEFAVLDGRPSPEALVGMGGAITNLTAVALRMVTYRPAAVHGSVLRLDEIDSQIELYRTSTVEERRKIVGLQPKRAEVILAGACIVRTVLTKLGRDSLTVSDRGLRHAVLVERFGQPV
jgi:exopolyphosphatase/guanosine-5'-triphosphate,3'-diphosphate pyrophosphatase